MKITKDLFVWKIITHKQASDIFHLGVFDVFKLNEDGSESMIESEEELLEAYYEKAVMGIEVGQLDLHEVAANSNLIASFWSKNDIIGYCQDHNIQLSEDETEQVRVRLERFHDAEVGINWDVIKCQIQMVIDERRESDSN